MKPRKKRVHRAGARYATKLLGEALEPRHLLAGVPQLLGDLCPGDCGSSADEFVALGDSVFFWANDTQLWKTDGTVAGTTMVKDLGEDVAHGYLHNHNGTLAIATTGVSWQQFYRQHAQLWRSDGTTDGTVLVRGFGADSHWNNGSAGAYFATVGDNLFGALDGDDGHGMELWKTDLTSAGTEIVKDINDGPEGAYPFGLTSLNGTLYFSAYDDVHGDELWKSDGSAGGTTLVSDIRPGLDGSYPGPLATLNGALYFAADDGARGRELWRSDGTEAGTVLVRDIGAGSYDGMLGIFGRVGNTLFLSADDGEHGAELWTSDGTEAGTLLVKDIRPGADGSYPWGDLDAVGPIGNTLLFAADDGVHGDELWASDGTAAGTILVKDIRPGSEGSNPSLYYYSSATIDGRTYFAADDGAHGDELWSSDGTAAGTSLVTDISGQDMNPGSAGSYPWGVEAVNRQLFFSADDGVHGAEPFVVTVVPPWSNSAEPRDVSGDTRIAPIDVLLVINELNKPTCHDASGLLLVPPPADKAPPYYDVNNDGRITPLDALLIINYLNSPGQAEGEAIVVAPRAIDALLARETPPFAMAVVASAKRGESRDRDSGADATAVSPDNRSAAAPARQPDAAASRRMQSPQRAAACGDLDDLVAGIVIDIVCGRVELR